MTIQREPNRIRALLDELAGHIAAEESGAIETAVQGGSFEAEVYWLAHNMPAIDRVALLRTAAILIEDIALMDLYAERSLQRSSSKIRSQ